MFRMLRTLPFALALTALSIFTAGCGSSSSTKFRLVNAIPNAPQAVDALIDGKVVETAVQFDTPPSAYLSVSSGSRHLQVFPTGTTTGAYFDGNVSLSSGSDYTVVATGSVTNNTIVAPLFTDNNTAPTSSNAAVRFIHASPSNQTPQDIYLVAPGTGDGGSPSISSVAYSAASTYLTVPAGSYDILITPTGFKSINITVPNVSFSAGQIRTYVLVDVPNGGAMSATPLVLNDLN